jgi:hypothetical protein
VRVAGRPYVALLLYLWVVWRPLKWVAARLLLGSWALAAPKTTGASKGCRTAEYESIGDGVDGSLSLELSTSTIRRVVAIGVCLDDDLMQGLIEADKHLTPVVHQNHLVFCGLLHLLLMPSYG